MEKIIYSLINNWTKGVDTYTRNDSTWLIFTDNKQWVIELTESKILWYNYNFFNQIFEFTSLDVLDNQHYITKWVEDNIINGVRHTGIHDRNRDDVAKNVIDKGVKETNHVDVMGFFDNKMEDTLQNGNRNNDWKISPKVEEILENGIKETKTPGNGDLLSTFQWMEENNSKSVPRMIDNVIENGVKSSFPRQYVGKDIIDRVIETHEDIYHHKGRIDGVIKNGVKEVIPYDEYKRGPINTFGYIDDIIKESEKINGTYAGGQRQSIKCKSVVEYGTKNPSV